MDFSNSLITWYLQHKRDLPWRETRDPYFIWLSEIMLQQTRVAQGLPYYLSFVNAFPTVFELASADEERVLKLWQGLGYYSRARNLHQTAKHVAFELGGKFPEKYDLLLKLKGVGAYTAAAIASFSKDEAVPVVDGNVFRVLSRFFGIETDIASAPAKKEFTALAFELMPKNSPAMFNQAIMEFGALQCVPKSPDCSICPLNSSCIALQKGMVNQLPVKSKKVKVRHRFFNYLIVSDDNERTIIQKRTAKGIWHNLYEFPLIESDGEVEIDLLSAHNALEKEVVSVFELSQSSIIHKLTHQHLHIRFWKVNIAGMISDGHYHADLHTFPFPIVLFNFIENDWR